jgi:hypothetical protein
MKIENLSHELDTKTMSAVRGGLGSYQGNADVQTLMQVLDVHPSIDTGAGSANNIGFDVSQDGSIDTTQKNFYGW